MPQGEPGLVRPEPIALEPSFNDFVVEFGGNLVADLLPTSADRPLNADYLFPHDNVIAELKSFEKDLFTQQEDVERLFKIVERHRDSGAVSGHTAFRWLTGQEPTPPEYRRDMLRLARRYIENAVRKANRQVRSTKSFLGQPDAHGLVLLANDGNYFSDPAEAVRLICQVMTCHFLESELDGFVYFSVNTPAKVPGNTRELNYWIPVYRGDGSLLSPFVNRLGAAWGSYYAKMIGQDVPRFQTDDIRVIKPMRLQRTRESR